MQPEVDYGLEAIQISFDARHQNAIDEWQLLFESACRQWQVDRARRLIQIFKSQDLDETLQGTLRFYEGALFVNLGDWKKAQKAFEQSIEIRKKLGDQKGELAAVNSLANLLRRKADTLDHAIETFQSALKSPIAAGASRIILLNGLGLSLYERGDLDQAQSHFRDVLDLAQQTEDQELRASALHNLGSIAWTRGRLGAARQLLEQADKIQQTTRDTHGQAETLNSLGLVLEGLGQWEEAILAYQNALEKMQEVADVYGQSQVLINLGNVYSLQDKSALAITCHEQAYEMARELGNPRLQGQALTALGDAYRMAGELGKAEEKLLQAVDAKAQAGEMRSIKHTWQSLGAVYHQQKRAAEAQSAYEKALQIARGQNDRRMEASVLLNLSILFTAQEKLTEAIPLLNDAKEIASTEGYNDCLAQVYEQEADLELLAQEPEAAKILEAFSLSLWHACHFNESELRRLIESISHFWLANAEDGEVKTSIWFCDSIIDLWKNMDQSNQCPLVLEKFHALKEQLLLYLTEE